MAHFRFYFVHGFSAVTRWILDKAARRTFNGFPNARAGNRKDSFHPDAWKRNPWKPAGNI
jgi:hypothetical protein